LPEAQRNENTKKYDTKNHHTPIYHPNTGDQLQEKLTIIGSSSCHHLICTIVNIVSISEILPNFGE